jgi:hypothetical protein
VIYSTHYLDTHAPAFPELVSWHISTEAMRPSYLCRYNIWRPRASYFLELYVITHCQEYRPEQIE